MEPTIRFSEFKDSWGNYKIEDIFDKIGIPVSLNDTQMYYEKRICKECCENTFAARTKENSRVFSYD
mgnify:CR=1 FL=1